MSCTSTIVAAPPVSGRTRRSVATRLQHLPGASASSSANATGALSRRHRIFLLLVIVWAIVVSHSGLRISRADDSPSRTAIALPPARFSRPLSKARAPELQVVAWFDQKGATTPPELKGKVQLVVFWGVNCPACIKKLPEVRSAASRHAGSDLVVIGLHNAQMSAERLQKFAQARDLDYPLAIDRSADSRYSFGMTTEAYQVRAIPHAAVVDRDGSLRFVGSFEQALQTAESLLNVTSG
jgi:peroxiredoxin